MAESPNKRIRLSPQSASALNANDDFVAFGDDGGEDDDGGVETKYGYGDESNLNGTSAPPGQGPRERRANYKDYRGQPWYDRKHAQDRPKSKHLLPGHEPWVLVKTRLGRRFAYNTQTRESLWRIPGDVFEGVKAFEREEAGRAEKAENARWAEEELRKMRGATDKTEVPAKNITDGGGQDAARSRRRRSESLQREDEEAMMAELAAEAEKQGEAVNVLDVQPEPQRAGDVGYDSEGSYEYVEVTDSEGEGGDEDEGKAAQPAAIDGQIQDDQDPSEEDDAPIEFGEDDIAYQLAAMGEAYGLDQGEYGADDDYASNDEQYSGDEEGIHGLPITSEEATHLFRTMLDDHAISPFTPWENLLADTTDTSIVHDDRYLILPSTRARHEAWQVWSKDTAARLRVEREKAEKKDPKVAYLALLAELAGPKCKLYWAEFKRKFKRELASGVDKKLGEKDREKLFRDYVGRWKLSEGVRKADLMTLLEERGKKGQVRREMELDELEGLLGGDVRWVSLSAGAREDVVRTFLEGLDAFSVPAVQNGDNDSKRERERKREEALAERKRQVEEERRKAEVQGRFAKRDLREEEAELKRAMGVGSRGLGALL